MYKTTFHTAQSRMCDLLSDHYAVLQVMSRFGLSLGFGDRTVAEVCEEHGVDTATFLAVVGLHIAPDTIPDGDGGLSVQALLGYLRNAHGYFLDFRLPMIRRKLLGAIDSSLGDVALAIVRYYDEYAAEVARHMDYEEQALFPHAEALLRGERSDYSLDAFRRRHDDRAETHLREFKNLIIKYYPARSSDSLGDVLFDLFTCERELASHAAVEDRLFVPAVERLGLDGGAKPAREPLSAREREIIGYTAKGLTNKQIAEALHLSVHTVITHRRNIAAKLQIHSAAGLTIYAIVHKLVDLQEVGKNLSSEQP